MKNYTFSSKDYLKKEIKVHNKKIILLYNEVLTNSNNITILCKYILTKLKINDLNNLIYKLPNSNCHKIKEEEIEYYLNNGYTIIIYKDIIAVELKSSSERGIDAPSQELTIGGAKDSFNENINTNLSLIRKRIKSNLKVDTIYLGRLSKTKINILSVDNITNKSLINNIIDKLNKIDIDALIDSSYLKYSLEDKNILPTIMMSERPDKCSMALLEGKVVILLENSSYAIILPNLFIDYFHSPDDYFQKAVNTTFTRILRLIAFIVSITLPGLYISVTTRNYNLIPISLLLMLKRGRTLVPFPAYIEALLLIISFEILRESDLRMSSKAGTSVSILGGLILGDAAVEAGIVSPIMIIIIAISSISGLVFTSIELSNSIRIYKLLILFLSTIIGIYGVLIGIFILIDNIYNTKIFGINYTSLNIEDSIIKIDKNKRYRNKSLTNNKVRGTYK